MFSLTFLTLQENGINQFLLKLWFSNKQNFVCEFIDNVLLNIYYIENSSFSFLISNYIQKQAHNTYSK